MEGNAIKWVGTFWPYPLNYKCGNARVHADFCETYARAEYASTDSSKITHGEYYDLFLSVCMHLTSLVSCYDAY